MVEEFSSYLELGVKCVFKLPARIFAGSAGNFCRFGARQPFEDVKRRPGQSNQENWRDPIRHAFSKTKREETDNSESLREPRLFRDEIEWATVNWSKAEDEL